MKFLSIQACFLWLVQRCMPDLAICIVGGKWTFRENCYQSAAAFFLLAGAYFSLRSFVPQCRSEHCVSVSLYLATMRPPLLFDIDVCHKQKGLMQNSNGKLSNTMKARSISVHPNERSSPKRGKKTNPIRSQKQLSRNRTVRHIAHPQKITRKEHNETTSFLPSKHHTEPCENKANTTIWRHLTKHLMLCQCVAVASSTKPQHTNHKQWA